jgi:antitoxin ParD1/3/4
VDNPDWLGYTPAMSAISIAIPAELEDFVSEAVASGRYAGPNSLIAAALFSFRDQTELEQIKLKRLRNDIAVGLEQIDSGDCAEWDVESFLARMKRSRP